MKNILKDHIWQLWNVCTVDSPGEGELMTSSDSIILNTPSYTLTETHCTDENGIYVRRDTLQNTSAKALTFHTLRSRFVFDGGEYEVYTQYNGWQNESQGQWSPLVTEITARCESVRSAAGAAPFLALWNLQTNRGIAFHLLTDASWSISAKRIFSPGENSYVGVELGIDAPNVSLTIPAGESFRLPEILYYEFQNKTDMDAWKLHRYCHAHMPRRRLPVIYNTWLYKFDRIDFDSVAKQIPVAARLGVEYFAIDAGWFGKDSRWVRNIGDWEENLNYGFHGRMKEIADMVRAHGMEFGLWLEAERAVPAADAVHKFPQYFVNYDSGCFINFADKAARDYIFDVLCGLVERYGISFFKFDFNADLSFDKDGMAFTEYFKGYRAFLKRVHEKYPSLYLSNCAAGGMRMTLKNCEDFESFWLSDNQSPYHGMRIVKDSILRLPPQVMERWAVIATNDNTIPAYRADYAEHIFATSDGTWDRVSDVSESWLKGFLSGGPVCLSCDLPALSDTVQDMLKDHIQTFKTEQDFWRTAECRILADTPSILVLQYNDPCFETCRIQVYTHRLLQTGITIYPVTDPHMEYEASDGTTYTSAALTADGIRIKPEGNYRMAEIRLTSIKSEEH